MCYTSKLLHSNLATYSETATAAGVSYLIEPGQISRRVAIRRAEILITPDRVCALLYWGAL